MQQELAEQRKQSFDDIPLESFPDEVQKIMRVFDADGDGTISVSELVRGADLYVQSENT